MGHIPHPKRAAKRNSTNKKGMLSCQHKINDLLLPPIALSVCITNRQRIEIKFIKVVDLTDEIILGILHNLSIRDIETLFAQNKIC